MTSSERSQTFTEQARRAQLLRAAIDTINELGYPRTSLSAIAKRAGVAKSAIAYYFSSKDALLLAVTEHVFGDFDQQVEQAVAQHSEPLGQLRAYGEAYLGYMDSHRAEFAAGFEVLVSHRNAEGVPLYLEVTDDDFALLRGILEQGMARGVFRKMPPNTAVKLVEALLDVPTTELQHNLEADLSGIIPEVLDSVRRVLEPPPENSADS